MKKIQYDVPLITQVGEECVQTSTAQLLQFYSKNKSVREIKNEVPVYVGEDGHVLGTSIGHIATFLQKQGFKTTLHCVDLEIFDQSWHSLPREGLLTKLNQRLPHLVHSRYDKEACAVIVDGYRTFLHAGGTITFPVVDPKYFQDLLAKGPFLAVVSYTFLNNWERLHFSDSQKKIIKDSIKGSPTTHMVVVSGCDDTTFQIVDPDPINGGIRTVSANKLMGSYYLAAVDMDAMLISVEV